jgi:hypothetical protein
MDKILLISDTNHGMNDIYTHSQNGLSISNNIFEKILAKFPVSIEYYILAYRLKHVQQPRQVLILNDHWSNRKSRCHIGTQRKQHSWMKKIRLTRKHPIRL